MIRDAQNNRGCGCGETENALFSYGGVKLFRFFGEWRKMGGEVDTRVLLAEPKVGNPLFPFPRMLAP